MNSGTFRITLHMVSSLDGFVAKHDNSVSWFNTNDRYDKGIELTAADIENFIKKIDCYLLGAATYEHAVELSKTHGWAYGDVPTVVVTSRQLPMIRQTVELYNGDLNELVNLRLKPKHQHVWLAGGPTLANAFLRLGLVDKIVVSVMPIILGDGVPFFKQTSQEQGLQLQDVKAYKNGIVEMSYLVKK